MKWLQLHKVIEEQSHQLESALPVLYIPAIKNSVWISSGAKGRKRPQQSSAGMMIIVRPSIR
jgi:hypothetical protein